MAADVDQALGGNEPQITQNAEGAPSPCGIPALIICGNCEICGVTFGVG